MLDRRCVLATLAAFSFLASAATAFAADKQPYEAAAFAAAQQAGKPILVEITASWCPTCKAQRPILTEWTAMPKFNDLAVFEVDFDSQKDVVRLFRATMQSTLIAYQGAREVARSVGDTDPDALRMLVDKTL